MPPQIVSELGLHRVSILEPDYWVPYPDGSSLTLWEEPGRTAEEIARFSKADADAYLEFDRYFDRLGKLLRDLLFVVPPNLTLRETSAPEDLADVKFDVREGGRSDPGARRELVDLPVAVAGD